MDSLIITGGQPLRGTVELAGAKNLASKLMLASLLADGVSTLSNVPDIGENRIATELLETAGAHVERDGTTLTIDPSAVTNPDLSAVSRNRLSILALAPLLARTGRAIVPKPGGDRIGHRPVNFHLDALRAFGVAVTEESGRFMATASALRGTTLTLPYPSVGATETTLLAASWAEGRTVVRNVAIEPEIGELVTFLRAMGAQITETAQRELTIDGTRRLEGARQRVMPDRLEAVSYASAALATGGEILIKDACVTHLDAYLGFLDRIGASYERRGPDLWVGRTGDLAGTTIMTDVHPGFMSDWQQPSLIVLLTATGPSLVHETVHDHRFGYVDELRKMGAVIEVGQGCQPNPCRLDGQGSQHVAAFSGPQVLRGASLTMPDARAGMAHVIAALAATGQSRLVGVDQLDRVYDRIINKLQTLGARVERRSEP